MKNCAVWASIALVPVVSGCGGTTTKDQATPVAKAVAIASVGSVGNEAIVVDSHYVYCADPVAGLVRVPKSGGAAVVLSNNVVQAGLVAALAVDAENVYWSAHPAAGNATVLLSQPLAGGTNAILSDSGKNVLAVAADGQNVYWLEEQNGGQVNPDNSWPGAVVRGSPSGIGAPVTVAPTTFANAVGYSIAVDSNFIYWTAACPANAVAYCGGALMKVPIAGGTPVRLATWSGPSYSQITVAPDGVYWGVPTGILKVPLTGGDPVTVIASPVMGVTRDEANVYWAMSDVMSAPLPSGAPTTRLAASAFMYSTVLAVDATSLYWVDSNKLMKLTPK